MENETQRLENVWLYRLFNSRGGTWIVEGTKEKAAKIVWTDGFCREEDEFDDEERQAILNELEGPVTFSVIGEPLDFEQDLLETHSGWRIWEDGKPTNHFVLSTNHNTKEDEIAIDEKRTMKYERFEDDAFGLVHLS